MFTALLKLANRRDHINVAHGRERYCFRLEVVYRAASRLTIAITFFSIFPGSPNVSGQEVRSNDRIEQAASLIRDNRIAEAERQLTSILRLRPKDAVALDLLGTIRAKQGRLSEAESLFIRAIRIEPRLAGAHMNLAYLYLLKEAHEKTASELREVLRLEPHNADASYKLAWLLLSQGKFDECISTIDDARQSQPPSAPLLSLRGDAYLRKENLDKAEESYLLALSEHGADADAMLGLATVYQSRGDAGSALLYLGRARRVIADSPDLLYKFALIALNSQLGDDAIIALKRAIELKPESSYYFVLGVTWLKKPDLQEAEQVFRQSLKLQPGNAQAQTYLGYTLLKQKMYPEAREWLEKSIQKDAPRPETLYYLGLIAQEQKEDERAVGFFEKSIHLSPSFAHPHIALGSTYLKMKNYPRAQQELEIGVKLSPDDSKAHYNLALLYARINDSKRAQEEMQIVERLKSSNGPTRESDLVTPLPPRPR